MEFLPITAAYSVLPSLWNKTDSATNTGVRVAFIYGCSTSSLDACVSPPFLTLISNQDVLIRQDTSLVMEFGGIRTLIDDCS